MNLQTRTPGTVSFSGQGGSGQGTRRATGSAYYSTLPGGVKSERTGWRDAALSERHRLWSFDCPMTDLDFLVCEYDRAEVRALVEYKHWNPARRPNLKEASYRAVAGLADKAGIPFFVALYSSALWWFVVYPANDYALEWFGRGEVLSEAEYVIKLMELRGRTVPEQVLSRLNTVKPEEVAR